MTSQAGGPAHRANRLGLGRATSRLQEHIDAGGIAGVVGAVVRHGKLVYLEALGHRNREAFKTLVDDAIVDGR